MKRNLKATIISLALVIAMCPTLYADNDGTASSKNEYTFSGSQYVVHTGTDNGFTDGEPLEKDDPHYGWSMGDFKVTGFTSYIKEADGTVVFLKNAGDTVRLGFEMQQDKEKLNDDEDIVLHYDTKAYDEYFQTKVYQHSMGLLVMQKTDYQNKPEEPIIYESFLAHTPEDKQVQLCEEGDYELALDYELEVDGSLLGLGLIDKDSYEDYRIYFKFKVRNGNCMIFPRTLSGNELTNESYSEDGFFIDFAKSRYLQIFVEYKVLVQGQDELIEDTRYNRPATDGERYTQAGIYEISIKNQYTDRTLSKTIYVGDDPTIQMIAIDGLSIEEVNEILYPEETTTVTSETEVTTTTETAPQETTVIPSESAVPTETTIIPVETASSNSSETGKRKEISASICAIGAVVLIALVFVVYFMSNHKNTALVVRSNEVTMENDGLDFREVHSIGDRGNSGESDAVLCANEQDDKLDIEQDINDGNMSSNSKEDEL